MAGSKTTKNRRDAQRTIQIVGSSMLYASANEIITGNWSFSGATTFANEGIHILDTDASHDMVLKCGSDYSADRTLSFVTGDASRTFTMNANCAVNQDLETTDNVVFSGATITNDFLSGTNTIYGDSTNKCVGVGTLVPTTIASYDASAVDFHCVNVVNASGAASLISQGATLAATSLVHTGGGADDKWFQARCVAGEVTFGSLKDDASAWVKRSFTVDLGTGNLTMIDGYIIGNVTGNLTGNADTATALETARTIGGVSFDGTANITVASATGGFAVSGGNLTLDTNDFLINTNKFTVDGATGDTGIKGEVTVEDNIVVDRTRTGFTNVSVTNDSTHVNASAGTAFENDSGATGYYFLHGSNRTLSRYGLTLADWIEITTGSSGGNGIVVGTRPATPIVFGTNDLERMRIDGAGAVTIQETLGITGITTTNGRKKNITRITSGDSPYTVLATDNIIECDTDGGAITTLYPAGVDETEYTTTNVGSSGNNVTMDGNGAEEIDKELTQILYDDDSAQMVFNSTEHWRIV